MFGNQRHLIPASIVLGNGFPNSLEPMRVLLLAWPQNPLLSACPTPPPFSTISPVLAALGVCYGTTTNPNQQESPPVRNTPTVLFSGCVFSSGNGKSGGDIVSCTLDHCWNLFIILYRRACFGVQIYYVPAIARLLSTAAPHVQV